MNLKKNAVVPANRANERECNQESFGANPAVGLEYGPEARTSRPAEFFDYQYVGGRFLGLVAVAVLSFGAAIGGGFLDPAGFAFSYLFAFGCFFTICVGALFWILVHHAVDAAFSVGIRRQLENLASLLPVLGILFIPLVFVAPILWTWMLPINADSPDVIAKWPFLTPWFFWLRAAFYFAFFSLAATWLRANSLQQDVTGSPHFSLLNRRLSFAGLPLFALCITFASVDWFMGLSFPWVSTIWGVYLFSGSALSALCVMVLIATALRNVGYLRRIMTVEHYHLLGNLMLAFTAFWAYIGFSQYMLIWYANIPEESVFFALRNTGSWNTLSTLLVVGHFVLPFILLLPRAGKRNPRFLCGVAIWLLLMHLLDLYLIVIPVLHPMRFTPSWMDVACLLAIGSTLAAVFLKRLGDVPLWPLRDPRLAESLKS